MIRISRLISMRGKRCLFSQSCHWMAKSEFSTTESQTVVSADDESKTTKAKVELLKTMAVNVLKTKDISRYESKPAEAETPVRNEETADFSKPQFSKPTGMLILDIDADAIKSAKPNQVYQFLKSITHSKNRPVFALKVIMEKLCESSSHFNLKQCSDILYFLARFSFKNEELLHKIAENIILQESKFTSGVLPTSILHSVGVLKFRHPELIEVCLKHTLEYKNNKRVQGLLTSLTTLAIVNFLSPSGSTVIEELSQCQDTDFFQTKSYLDFVWACVLLNHLSKELISKVLSENYIKQLDTYNASVGNSVVTDLKLQNINAAAKTLMSSYKGPFLKKSSYCRPQITKSKFQFLSSVMNGLSYIFPQNGYLRTSKNTGAGFLLDVECCLDSDNKPVMIDKGENRTKIALILLDYNDCCIAKEKALTGITAFKMRILEAQGYKIITIPFDEFPNSLPVMDKVEYLKTKLKAS